MIKLVGYYEVKNIPKYANTNGPHKSIPTRIHKENQKGLSSKIPPHQSDWPFLPTPRFNPPRIISVLQFNIPPATAIPDFFKKSRDSSTALRSTQSWRTTRSTPSMRPRICCTSERVPTGGVSMMI